MSRERGSNAGVVLGVIGAGIALVIAGKWILGADPESSIASPRAEEPRGAIAAELEPLAPVLEEDRAELAVEPPSDAAQPAPRERVYHASLVLHVRDRTTRVDLTDIELRCLAKTHWRASWRIPDACLAPATAGRRPSSVS